MSAPAIDNAVGRILYGPNEIAAAVERLAAEIAADYSGQALVLLGVLKGALCFTADLARRLAAVPNGPSEIMVDYLCVERYGAGGTTPSSPRLAMDCAIPLRGANVVILEAIVDQGRTLEFLGALLECRHPAGLKTCALFDKRACREVEVPINYLGLTVPNLFVIGYGLDYQEVYRNLPYLAELREGQDGITTT